MSRYAKRVKIGAVALATAALLFNAVPATPAFAYFNFGTVRVSPGAGFLRVTAGGSTATNVNVSPGSHAQTQGCGMAKCPQVCDSEGAEAGYHCADANGQCTCAGSGYSTYYAQTSASSSNPGVATAYMSGNTLYVTGKAAGTATINISSSLRQWSTGYATVTVQVDAPPQPAPAPDPAPSQPSNSGNGNAGNAGNTGNSGNAGNAGGAAAAPEAAQPSASGIPEAATTAESTDDKLNEEVIDTEGGKVTMVEANSYLNTADELKKIAGKKEQLIIWSGSSSDQPDYSWTFWGEDVSADDPNLDFDPTIDVSSTGTGTAANIVKQAKDARVLEFAHKGKLPGKATLTIKAGDEYPDGTELSLFRLNSKKQVFKSAQDDKVKADGGYFAFQTTEGGTFAVSTDDLSSYKVIEENTPGAAKKQKDADDQAAASQQSSTPLLVAAGAVVVAAVAVVIALVMRRKKSEAAIAQRVKDAEAHEASDADASSDGDEASDAGEVPEGDEAAPAADEVVPVEETDQTEEAAQAEEDAPAEEAASDEEAAPAEDDSEQDAQHE